MNSPKVLVACPVHEVKAYCIDSWLNHLKQLSYKNFDIFLSDNSPTPAFSEGLKAKGYNCKWNNPKGKNIFMAMLDSHEDCRKHAIDKGYDYLFHLECDVFVPTTAIIQNFIQHNKPVVAGLYHFRNGSKSQLLTQRIIVDDKYGFETTNVDWESDLSFVDGKLKQVFSAGIGCCMIRRDVFEKIPFRADKDISLHPDTFFCVDLRKNKIPYMVDTSVICRHDNLDWNQILSK